ncbi:MAG TPA: GNVR domain-containing protein [Pyrinomonadaceae bacterium]|nr:GNVR domain-containing protein [Pyrinomonadaceae bacterium]
MSAEFRQRKPSEYAQIFWRRKWLIVLPTAAVALAVGWVVWRLPNVYESTTLLTVRPASISSAVFTQLSDKDLSARINNISQEVNSRSALEPLIERYNLYAAERRRGEAMDTLVERMRTKDITIKINTTRDEVTNGFYLSFRTSDPRDAQNVTAELARKYVDAQAKAAGEEATLTKEFFEEKLRQEKERLDEIDKRRLDFMRANVSNLPTQAEAMIGQLAGMREQQKTLMMEIGRLNDQRASDAKFLADLSKAREQDIIEVAEKIEDPKSTLGYAELVKRKAQLESERQNLLTTFKPKHPDVISVQNQIDSIQRQMDEMVEEGKRKIDEKRKRLEEKVDPRLNSYKSSIARLDGEIQRQKTLLAQTEAAISQLERRINLVPGSEVGLEAINRDYQSQKAVYESTLEQQKKAEIGAEIANRAQGENIAVLDPASLPERPVAPNRPMLLVLGLLAGLGCGLALAAAFEVPRMLTIQTAEDAEHYTGLPVLVTMPVLLTPREQRNLKLRRAALAVAGLAFAVMSVPALAFLLRATRLIEMFASRG